MQKSIHYAFLTLFIFFASFAQAATIRVDASATGANDGSTWDDAYTSLQSAVAVAATGDEVWVAAGTYIPSAYPVGLTSTDIRDYSFYLESGVGYYGGFDGTESLRSQRDYTSNATILSGDIAGANCYHVVVSASESALVLDGFTINAGYANGGGGATINGNSDVLRNEGGAINASGSSVTISNCILSSNIGGTGGAIASRGGGSLTVNNTVFANNSALVHGGAFYKVYGSGTAFTNCVFYNNLAMSNTTRLGGAIMLYVNSGATTVTNCTFFDNKAGDKGGAIYSYDAAVTAKNTLFYDNYRGSSKTVNGSDLWNGGAGTRFYMTNCLMQLTSASYTPANSNPLTSSSNCVFATNPLFIGASDPDGADNAWMTADDGLSFFSNSPAQGVGTSSGAPSTDITGASRAASPSVGAYEGFSYTRYYVDASATGANTGTSWTDAFRSLQSAVASATTGVEVWVAAGTYIPSAYPAGRTSTDIREYSFYLGSGVEYYGGFAGTETMRSQRDYANNVTILSGNIAGNNCYHVLVSASESSVVLDGFTVTAGHANGGTNATINGQSNFWANNGGAIFTQSTTMTVANCIISNNTAGYGGAIKGEGSNTTLTNCKFTSNTGTAHAGVIDMGYGTLAVGGCTFANNTTATGSNGNGGALKISYCTTTISNTSFTSNVGRIGGAIHASQSGLTISTCTFSNNSVGHDGGAIYAASVPFSITKSIFDGNTATNNGGAISTGWGAIMTLDNSVFSENTSGSSGGAISNDMQNGSAINCTFYANTAVVRGGAYSSAQISNHINGKNCVFFGNKKGTSTNVPGADTYGGSFTHSLTQSNSNFSTGTGIVNNQDPLFRDASDPDGADNVWMTADDGLSFFSNSPAYHVGTSSGAPSTDITGASRASSPSMGAYEGLSYTRYLVDINATGTNAGTSWTNAYTRLQDAIDASSVGDEIWIAAGTYKPLTIPVFQFVSTNNRDKAFTLNKNISIYGGFDGTETSKSQRNSASNLVTLSGDLGTVGASSDNSYHVFMTANLSSSAIIEGLTIQDGNANGGNYTNQYSGRNFARGNGGGMSNNISSPTLSNLVFKNNLGGDGAAINNRGSSTIHINVVCSNNTSGLYGGGVSNLAYGSPQFINCVFSENTADHFGGAIYSDGSSPIITNCTFSANVATTATSGGAVCGKGSSTTTISNSLFYGNKIGSSTTNVCSDIKNFSTHTTTISNSLVQLASGSYTSGNSNALTSATNMVYSGNPLFINVSDPDGADNVWMTKDDGLKLKSTSPSLDVGLNSAISSYSTDILGTPRVVNTTVNMGAYEMSACQQGNTLPTTAGTYTATYSDIEGSYTCYCDDNGQFILGLDLNSTGAVVPTTGVSLEIGVTTTTSWSTAGGIITNANGGAIINRKWDVVPTTQPTSDVTVIFPFTHTEYGDVVTALSAISTTITNANQLEMYKLTSAGTFADPHASGATGVALPHGASASTSNWVWSQHGNGTDHLATYKVASFSGGGGGGGASGSPLPVELIHFDAQAAANHTADLDWATASEINNNYFDVERSYDGITFETVGNVTGNGTTNQFVEYSFTDKSIATRQNTAYYRLKQVDFDGEYEYSGMRVVRFDGNAEMLEIAAYPNPFNQEVTIHVNANEPYTIEVTDINGVVVLSVDRTENRTHRLDVSEYTSGVYIIEVTSTQGTQHLKIIKQ